MEKGPHTLEYLCSIGSVVYPTGALLNISLYMAWMQTVHLESFCVYPSITDYDSRIHISELSVPCS